MPNKSNSLSRLSPVQALLVLLLFAVAFIYQAWNRGAEPDPATPPKNTPQQHSGRKVTVTPARAITPTDTVQANPFPPTNTPASADIPPGSMSKFDYFVLALSWSPDYCASNGGSDPQQCSTGKKLGFVLHGLWPQNNQGYPSNCSTEKMSAEVKAQFPGLYPSDALYDHEWEKHGTCTGLSPVQYLTLSRQIKESVLVPSPYRSPAAPFRTTVAQLKQEFTQANQGFEPANLAVYCSSSGRYLKELYVCFSREGEARSCSTEVQKDALKSCQSPNFLVRNTR